MSAPKNLFQGKILIPLIQFRKKYISRSALYTACNKTANFIFDKSKETALILLIFNAVSILSSHIAQIQGLRKSDRESKDYLVTQEWQELGLDLLFTIIPPFLINNYLMKKLDSGHWTTKSARNYMIFDITPKVGVCKDEIYNIEHIRPVKETLGTMAAKVLDKVSKIKNLPKSIEKIIKFIEKNPHIRIPDPNRSLPIVSMEDITTDFDLSRKKLVKYFYNGKAYDEICGQRNGLLILATLGYTILASAVITPILKNKLANRSYEKQLIKQEEEAKNIDVRKKFENISYPLDKHSGVFDSFSYSFKSDDSSDSIKSTSGQNILPVKETNIFSNFINTYNKNYTSQGNMRI